MCFHPVDQALLGLPNHKGTQVKRGKTLMIIQFQTRENLSISPPWRGIIKNKGRKCNDKGESGCSQLLLGEPKYAILYI